MRLCTAVARVAIDLAMGGVGGTRCGLGPGEIGKHAAGSLVLHQFTSGLAEHLARKPLV